VGDSARQLHRQRRRRKRRGIALGLASLVCACAPPPDEGSRGAILVSVDTLRADRLGAYGYTRPTSPFLDRFAAEGLLFENAVAQSPWTLPSHASMLTGLFPHRHGVVAQHLRLAREVPTLAATLRAGGVSTAGLVHSQWLSARQGLRRGFESWTRFAEDRNRAGAITDAALAWLAARGEEPFFLFVHYYDVHSDYAPMPAFRDLFVGEYSGPADGSTEQLMRVRSGELRYSPADLSHVSDLYDAEIRQLDAELERLLAGLAELGLEDRTLVIVTSDHGEEFQEHGGVLHGRTMYEEVLRVPLILRGPGVPADRRVAELALVADVAPTLLGWLGVLPAEPLDGVDLLASIASPEPAGGERRAFAAADWRNAEPDSQRMLRSLRFKWVHDRVSGRTQLFDLVSDPAEREDVSAGHADLMERFRRELPTYLKGGASGESIGVRSQEEIDLLRRLGYVDE
jgi:arylsulfatase A-like enzyme